MKRTPSENIARIITALTISPFTILAYMIFSRIVTDSIFIVIFLDFISGIFFLLIPSFALVYLYFKYARGKKIKLRGAGVLREHRWILFLIGFAVYFISYISYFQVQLFFQIDLTIFFNLINVYFLVMIFDCILTLSPMKLKTSMHMSGNGSMMMVIYLTLDHLWFLLFLFLPIIFWARWKSKGHTIPQLISGTTIGLCVPLIYFYIYDSIILTATISTLILVLFIVLLIKDKFPDEHVILDDST
ncbi:MAG: hypothetical protein ACTSVY_06540 [Candidatus Helarchaeota archaeon]